MGPVISVPCNTRTKPGRGAFAENCLLNRALKSKKAVPGWVWKAEEVRGSRHIEDWKNVNVNRVTG